MNPYAIYVTIFKCKSIQELYECLERIAKKKLHFPLSALENPPANTRCPVIDIFIQECYKSNSGDKSDEEAKKLIEVLKKNPPKKSYGNPKFPKGKCSTEEKFLMNYIFNFGIDLPASKYNPYGNLQSYSSFFIDMFFGNYTEFIDHVHKLSRKQIYKELEKREGYCKYSPIFAPILGLKMLKLDSNPFFTYSEKEEIRMIYTGHNENKHYEILEKLLELGADANNHDIYGYTPLHHAAIHSNVDMVTLLLKCGANPNLETRGGTSPLALLLTCKSAEYLKMIETMLQYNAKLSNKKLANLLRTHMEAHGDIDLVAKVREAMPRGEGECEKCVEPAEKKCSGCSMVYYCSPACQKLDWKFHKGLCKKERSKK